MLVADAFNCFAIYAKIMHLICQDFLRCCLFKNAFLLATRVSVFERNMITNSHALVHWLNFKAYNHFQA